MKILLRNASKDRQKWLSLKQSTIGGSEAYDAADVDEGSAPLKPWLKLRGESAQESGEVEPLSLPYFGLQLEQFVAEEFCREYVRQHPGADVKLLNPDALMGHQTIDWLTATPDRHVIINGELCNLNGKTAHQSQLKYWEGGGCPNRYRAQVLHEAKVQEAMGMQRSFLACLVYVPAFFIVEVPHDPNVIEELVRRESTLIDMVKTGTVPPVKNATGEDLAKAFWEVSESDVLEVEEGSDDHFLITTYAQLHGSYKLLEERKKVESAELLNRFGKYKRVVTPDGYRVTLVRQERSGLDLESLRRDQPDVDTVYGYKSRTMFPRVYPPKAEKVIKGGGRDD
jgi:predicted phage-related endonuclease